MEQFARAQLLLGADGIDKLRKSRVAVFGVGGVGGYVVEALVRSGIGAIDIIDDDKVCVSNINRQIIADLKSIGRYKVDVARDRILDINPDCSVVTHQCFYLPENSKTFEFDNYDYVVDAIDTVTGKIELAICAQEKNVPIISSMGAGNKLNPTMFEVADIYKTSVCPLAKIMRRELKRRGVRSLKVVYSRERAMTPVKEQSISSKCISPTEQEQKSTTRRSIPGSVAFVPSVVGLIIAGEVVKDITGVRNE